MQAVNKNLDFMFCRALECLSSQEATMTREPVRNLTESEYPPIDYEAWRRRALAVLVARYPDRREDWNGRPGKPDSCEKK